MRSRSARKFGFVGASGARCVVANWRAAEISGEFVLPFGLDVQARISSMSCSRSREKCKESSVSSSCESHNRQLVAGEIRAMAYFGSILQSY